MNRCGNGEMYQWRGRVAERQRVEGVIYSGDRMDNMYRNGRAVGGETPTLTDGQALLSLFLSAETSMLQQLLLECLVLFHRKHALAGDGGLLEEGRCVESCGF